MRSRQATLVIALGCAVSLFTIAEPSAWAGSLTNAMPHVQGTRRIVLEQLEALLGKNPQLQLIGQGSWLKTPAELAKKGGSISRAYSDPLLGGTSDQDLKLVMNAKEGKNGLTPAQIEELAGRWKDVQKGLKEGIEKVFEKADPKAIEKILMQYGFNAEQAAAIVQTHFFGQEGGNAVAAVLDGRVNPSGKLTSSYPLRYQDNPAYFNYPGNREHNYGEGVFMGYRYYDLKDMEVLFPFGHGLSYTQFAFSDMRVTGSLKDGSLTAQFTVKNVGAVDGAEVAQLYVADLESRELRPPKELKGFKKVFLKAGEASNVALPLDRRAFSFFDPHHNIWVLEPGLFEILVGSSSRNIHLRTRLEIAI